MRHWTTTQRVTRIGKPLVFVSGLLPLLWAALAAFGIAGQQLGANPVETLMDHFGNWSLYLIIAALAVTPIRRLTGWHWVGRFRRMIGLFTAFYVTLHLAVYALLDQGLAIQPIVEDILKRPFITLGILAWTILMALSATSLMAVRRRMGKRWQQLHNSVYLIGILAVWHFWWQVKKDITEPLLFSIMLAALLGIRVFWRCQRTRSARTSAVTPATHGNAPSM
ncbi:MAG: protein-methionine-sulfoxide reductase heme-binding subunit MsrQ [Pseudomonadota bacterium]